MKTWVLLTCLAVWAVNAGAQPCSSKDSGPFLATQPTLTVDMYEASAADLAANPGKYRGELRLNGQVGGQGSEGIVLEVMPDYSFMNPEDSFRFEFNGGNNYVQMYKPVDRDGPTAALDDDTNVYSFTLKCSLYTNMSDVHYYNTKIFVLDINDNDPAFVGVPSNITLNELSPPGQAVLTVKAEDKDVSSNLTYSVVPRANLADDMSAYFSVDGASGAVRVKKSLDYETMAEGTLVLAVQDGMSPARSATVTVAVRVEDGDDQGPVYVYPGCWIHRARCSWPKFTTSTALTQGEAIAVWPVPNKVQSTVMIKARDLDHSANPVIFSIASTIPPGQESMFTVSTSQTGRGEYAAIITPTTTTKVKHGFEIFLQAEEQSAHRRFEVAMIFFEDPNNACSSGTSSAQTRPKPTDPSGTNNPSNPSNPSSSTDDDDDYTKPVIALIVVVAILAAFIFCLAIAFFCAMRRSSASRNNDVTLTQM